MTGMQTVRLAREPAWKSAALLTGGFVAVLWLLEIVDTASGHALDAYGVQPRTEDGLVGIALAPVLHFGFDHLVSNTVPVLVLGFLTLATGIARGLLATAIIWVVGGLGVWLFAEPASNHAGASVLIFGWIVYLVVRGFLNRAPSRSCRRRRLPRLQRRAARRAARASPASRGRATCSGRSAASSPPGC